ncbi:MAG TPA: glycosyltransferase family 2 protein [Candidatus Saccharimonadales bacterium]|nr:glycosyltransferase family 2 protein [Candidatus Saccharimonadales bacterium]
MTDLEIPYEKDRRGHYRFFEILPGALSYLLLLAPILLSIFDVTLAVFFILAYLLIFFVRSLAYSTRAIVGYFTMRQQMKLDWNGLVADVEAGQHIGKAFKRPKWHTKALERLAERPDRTKPSQLLHAVIIATVNESREVLEPTIQAVANADYDSRQIILVLAYEARAGQESEDRVHELLALYKDKFRHAMAVKHPANIPGEVIGKGGNVTNAGRQLQKYLKKEQIDPAQVVVTTLDADNRPDKRYFAALSYLYCVAPDPLKASYQPLPMFTNNIWDAPTLMRVIAVGNNLFYIVGTQRPHQSRNFSAHAQSMRALIDMDFWSVRTVVEDGHHFWRSYFHFDGDYRVYPLSIPIYQDAVLAEGYLRTIKAQFYQLRRWTYGASDIAYVADKGFWHKNKANKFDVFGKFMYLLQNHVNWATSAILVLAASFIPPLLHPHSLAANELPLIASRVQRLGLAGLLVMIYVSLVTLPPRPARHKRHRSVLMIAQWVLLPVTGIAFGCLAAFNSQTRLMFKWYLSKFDVTEKATVTASGRKVTTKADPGRAKKSRRRLHLRRH